MANPYPQAEYESWEKIKSDAIHGTTPSTTDYLAIDGGTSTTPTEDFDFLFDLGASK